MLRALGRADPWLMGSALALLPLGVFMVHVATVEPGDARPLSDAALRQALVAVAGAAAIAAAATFDYRGLRHLAAPAGAATVGLLILVLIAGSTEYGARRWLGAGAVSFQPAEFAKVGLAVALAGYASMHRPGTRAVLGAAAAGGAVLALVLLEPDAGTATVLGLAWLATVVVWGVRWRLLGGLFVAAAAPGPLLFALAVPSYQRERLAVFVDPTRDPLGSGFSLRQAEVALRSGGLMGRRLFDGAGSALEGLSTRGSDFAFAHAGEQLGALGLLLILGLLGVIIVRGLRAARLAPDTFGRLLATWLTAAIGAQALVHAAANLRLIPATGIPLPFISQGGSSLLAMCLAVGLLESIAARRTATTQERWRAKRWH